MKLNYEADFATKGNTGLRQSGSCVRQQHIMIEFATWCFATVNFLCVLQATFGHYTMMVLVPTLPVWLWTIRHAVRSC